jgi:hypothetical protein
MGLGAKTNRKSQSNSDALVAGQSPGGKYISTEAEDIVGIRHQATSGEDTADWEDLVPAVVSWRVCELVISL